MGIAHGRKAAGKRMGHEVDGYEVTYTSRTSWKVKRMNAGLQVDVVPVTWADTWRRNQATKENFLHVWFKDGEELERHRVSTEPFVVALAAAHDPEAHPRVFKEFRAIYEVAATGVQFDPISIEVRVVRRLNARRDNFRPA